MRVWQRNEQDDWHDAKHKDDKMMLRENEQHHTKPNTEDHDEKVHELHNERSNVTSSCVTSSRRRAQHLKTSSQPRRPYPNRNISI